MTREKAIKMLKSKMDGHTDTSYEWTETVRMAIKALEQQTCEDAVSRKAVLNIDFRRIILTTAKPAEMIEQKVKALPPVNPQPKTGHWIRHVEDWEWWECSECHSIRAYGNEYCPDCGSHNEDVRNKLKIREVK